MGVVAAFDLAVNTGFAIGAPGAVPHSGAVRLKKASEPRAVAFSNLIAFLRAQFVGAKPDLMVVEAPLALQAFAKLGGQDVVQVTYGFHAIAAGMAARHGIRFEEVSVATARKHFLGRANLGDRAATKAAVVARCHLLGLMPKDRHDDNQADAICVHDWACATLMRVAPKELHLFGERPPSNRVEF